MSFCKKTASGICRLCGLNRMLTFEHIPPRRAFNNDTVVYRAISNAILVGHKTTIMRRGLGRHALCGDCNAKTGRWYGPAFADWTKQLYGYSGKLGYTKINAPFTIKPLNVLKQAAVMMLALAEESQVEAPLHTALRKFVLDPISRQFPHGVSIVSYLTDCCDGVMVGKIQQVNVNTMESVEYLGDVCLPPAGYAAFIASSRLNCDISKRITNLNPFAQFHYEEVRSMWIPMASVHHKGTYPLNFKSPART